MLHIICRTLAVLLLVSSAAFGQTDYAGLKIFGYFQASLGFEEELQTQRQQNSFTLQQLNLFLQRDLTQSWTAFINMEFVNSYSSLLNWGAFSLEEAWINYRGSDQFKLKLGLLTPAFNNLNEIKNRTPLLPYIIRPLVYESSLREVFVVEDFAPARAFVQAYGFIPAGTAKFDYAAYLGNSPNINSDNSGSYGPTGLDTSRTFLFGSRVGMRYGFFKAGLSSTLDKEDLSPLADTLKVPERELHSILRTRLGGDLSYHDTEWLIEAEFISVYYDFDRPQFNFDLRFLYGTLGYHFSERFFAYGSYWFAHGNYLPIGDESLKVPTFGVTYTLNDMIILKAQMAQVHAQRSNPAEKSKSAYTYLAISVVF
ncbi:MAG: hypothetical protein ACREOO_00575 [bacterium]